MIKIILFYLLSVSLWGSSFVDKVGTCDPFCFQTIYQDNVYGKYAYKHLELYHMGY